MRRDSKPALPDEPATETAQQERRERLAMLGHALFGRGLARTSLDLSTLVCWAGCVYVLATRWPVVAMGAVVFIVLLERIAGAWTLVDALLVLSRRFTRIQALLARDRERAKARQREAESVRWAVPFGLCVCGQPLTIDADGIEHGGTTMCSTWRRTGGMEDFLRALHRHRETASAELRSN